MKFKFSLTARSQNESITNYTGILFPTNETSGLNLSQSIKPLTVWGWLVIHGSGHDYLLQIVKDILRWPPRMMGILERSKTNWSYLINPETADVSID